MKNCFGKFGYGTGWAFLDSKDCYCLDSCLRTDSCHDTFIEKHPDPAEAVADNIIAGINDRAACEEVDCDQVHSASGQGRHA